MASLVFDIKPHVYRAAKRHGLYSYSEVNESHIGTIAAAGVLTNLVFAVIGYLLGFAYFSKINIYFAFFNMLPISELDGNKIFFGNLLLWAVYGLVGDCDDLADHRADSVGEVVQSGAKKVWDNQA